jgi:hypothetical protein
MSGNLKKYLKFEAVSHQGRPKPRVAVRPLQSRVSKFRLSSRRPNLISAARPLTYPQCGLSVSADNYTYASIFLD